MLWLSVAEMNAQAINLIGNGGFESVSSQPGGPGELFRASTWTNCNGQAAFPYGTPDLFTGGGSGGSQWPSTFAGTVVPQSGDALAGFITSNFFVPDFREYTTYRLEAPLLPGQTYSVSFWLTNGSGNWYGSRGSNNIGAAFTLASPVQVQHEPLAIVPQIELTSIIHHTFWQQYTFTFAATQPFQYITIGNFRNDLNTSIATFTTGNGVAYYFIDNIAVSAVLPLPAEAVRLQQVDNDAVMELAWHLPEGAAGDQIVLERSLDQSSFIPVEDFGQVTNPGTDVSYTDQEALPGLQYYYRLREVTVNGELMHSPVVAAKFGEAGDFVAGNVYPNPATAQFSLDFTALTEGDLEMRLLDGTGRLVLAADQSLGIGQPSGTYALPAGLAAGIYHAQFNFEGQSFTHKVVVAGLN
ncbi:MAG TPA: T9SS type A sorting domain-containing protein [Bacteroidia bacterium]|nr:T9SS type A sorting domain-containing protein [Bacteroidia bacterium]